jgi:nucleoside-diphosphate-sugar epimerase
MGRAISAELVAAGRPPLQLAYKPDFRQAIADTWPRSLDDSNARRDWGWAPKYDITRMTRVMLKELGARLAAKK